MPTLAARILFGLLLVCPLSLLGQYTQVTATIVDPNGLPYASCSFSINFVGQNTVPGHPPYTLGGAPGGQFQQQVAGSCTAAAVLSTTLADNNQIFPVPSQWEFTICDSTQKACFNSLCTVTGATLDVSACINANSVPLPPTGGGGGGGITGAVQGQPIYGATGGTGRSVPTELAADTFAGGDICAKIMAAEAALPANGGTIRLSAQNYPVCAASITINKPGVNLRGAGGAGNWGLGTAATVLNFPPGVSGIVGVTGAENMVIENLYVKSASTAAGTDDGITLIGGSPRISRVTVQGFGRNGVVMTNNTDLWRMESVYADHNRNDGFYWVPGCSDENAGMASILSATSNGKYGYELQCGGANDFHSTHAANNGSGAWLVNVTYDYFWDTYVESGPGSSFTFTATAAYNTAYFNAFGQPATLIDLGVYGTNTIYYEGGGGQDGIYPAVTSFSLTGPPQQNPGVMYSFIAGSGGYHPGDLIIRERVNNKNIAYYANNFGWNFLTPITVGIDNQIAGTLTLANGSVGAHTTIRTQATSNTTFSLPATNGTSGNCLITDGSGNTSWATSCGTGGPGGGLTSINGDTTPAQTLIAGTNITITNSGTGGHTINSLASGITNSAGPNVVTKSDGTNVIASSITDSGTAVVTPEPLTAATLTTGTGATGCPLSGCWAMTEAATPGTPTPGSGVDYCRADSTTHGLLCSFNGGSEAPLGGTGGSPPFSSVTAGTNTSALVMGTGGSMTTSGTGTIAATTAANLSGTPALPNGTTATTQTVGDNTTKIATDAFVLANGGSGAIPCKPFDQTQICMVEEFYGGGTTTGLIGTHGWSLTTVGSAGSVTIPTSVWPHVGVRALNTAATATQGQGATMTLGSQLDTPAGPTVTNWTFSAIFQLQDITTTWFFIGLFNPSNALTGGGSNMGLRFNVNSPLSAQAITSIVCTTTVCTVTDAGGTINLPGQVMTISGAVCPTRNVNGNQLMTTYVNATTWRFTQSGAAETCTTPGTVTSVAETTFKFTTITGNIGNATVVDTGVTADTNWHTLQIQSTVAGTIVFTLDGGTPASISTTIPSGPLTIGLSLGTDVTLTTAKSVNVDRITFQMTGLTR